MRVEAVTVVVSVGVTNVPTVDIDAEEPALVEVGSSSSKLE